jgi:predicted GTPase
MAETNDFPFVRPDLHVVVADALRPDDALGSYPGRRTADVVVVNKANAASAEQVDRAIAAVRAVNARAPIVCGAKPTRLEPAASLRGRRVLVIEDGPTITRGSMPHGRALPQPPLRAPR